MGIQQLDLKLQRGTYGLKSVFSFALRDADGNAVNPKDPTIVEIQLIAGTMIQRLLSDGGLTIDTNNNVVWVPTADEIEALPQGRTQQYYLEIVYNDTISGDRYLEGYMIVNGVPRVAVTQSDAKPLSTGNNAQAAASTP